MRQGNDVTVDELTFLASPAGRRLLETIAEMPGDSLSKQAKLRREHPAELVRAALTLQDLRVRAQSKFENADRMFFDREGLEQASGDVIAEHRAKRYAPFGHVADLCCGIGGDSTALAQVAQLTSVDIRPERVAMARANVWACGAGAQFVCADVRRWCPGADAVFIDPSRREGGRRVTRLNRYAPPVDDLSWLTSTRTVGIKVAPGIDHDELPETCEAEFISVSGECKEAVLWFGDLRSSAGVRATLLPEGDFLIGESVEPVPCGPVSDYMYEPDRAVIRAHLVEQVAVSIGAHKLAPDVAYLTSDSYVKSLFARAYGVDAVLPFSIKRVQTYLSDHGVGRLEIKKRRFPMTPDAVRGKLNLKGSEACTLILTRVNENPTAIFCHPVPAA